MIAGPAMAPGCQAPVHDHVDEDAVGCLVTTFHALGRGVTAALRERGILFVNDEVGLGVLLSRADGVRVGARAAGSPID